MEFKDWIQKYKNADNPFGDLAKDILRDGTFPTGTDYGKTYRHLKAAASRNVRDKVLRTFREAWAAFAKNTGLKLPSEAEIEHKFCKEASHRGCVALKFTPVGWSGAPDRIVLFPNGIARFVEFKVLGAEPRPLQKLRLAQLRDMGFDCFVIDSLRDVDAFFAEFEVDTSDNDAFYEKSGYDELEGYYRL
jgi:hypothetical protein